MSADRRLEGKIAIVTGGGTREGIGVGTGRATAQIFASEGAKVMVVDLDEQAASRTVEVIRAEGGDADYCIADVSDATQCANVVERTVSIWGSLHILNNNVGIGVGGTILEANDDEWARAIDINIGSYVKMSRVAIPQIAKAGGGAIINLSSVSALRPRGLTPYSTTKGAIISLTRAMAIDCAAQGIRVNCIVPGPILTPMVSQGGLDDETRERRRRATPLGIEGSGWDVGYAALFLASEESRFITGVSLPVDGGACIRSPQS